MDALLDHQCWLASGGKLGKQLGSNEEMIDFYDHDLDGVDFSLAELSRCRFDGSSLRNAWFIHANLYLTDFEDCDVRYARFDGADLTQAAFAGAKYSGARFVGANTKDVLWTEAQADCREQNKPNQEETLDCGSVRNPKRQSLDVALEEWRKEKAAAQNAGPTLDCPAPSP